MAKTIGLVVAIFDQRPAYHTFPVSERCHVSATTEFSEKERFVIVKAVGLN